MLTQLSDFLLQINLLGAELINLILLLQDLLIEGLNLSLLRVVFLHFFLDEALFDAKLFAELGDFLVSLLLHFCELFFEVSLLDLDRMVLVIKSLILLRNLLVLGLQIELYHIVLILDLMQARLVGLELLLLLCEPLLDGSFFIGDLFDLLILEPGSGLNVVELIHGLGRFVSGGVQLSLLFLEIASHLFDFLFVLIFNLRDLLGLLGLFELLSFSSHFFGNLLYNSFILFILLCQFLGQLLVHLFCQIGSDLLVVQLDVRLIHLIIFALDLSFLLLEHLLVFALNLLFSLLLEFLIFLSKLMLKRFLLGVEFDLLLVADLGVKS